MLHFITGPEIFQLSLHNYLKNSELGYSNFNQLWDVFTTTIQNNKPEILPEDINVKKIMEPWLRYEGYPLVTATRNYELNYITFKQVRHLSLHALQK